MKIIRMTGAFRGKECFYLVHGITLVVMVAVAMVPIYFFLQRNFTYNSKKKCFCLKLRIFSNGTENLHTTLFFSYDGKRKIMTSIIPPM